MAQIARKTGLGRESLYKALSPEGNPEFATILKVVRGARSTLARHHTIIESSRMVIPREAGFTASYHALEPFAGTRIAYYG